MYKDKWIDFNILLDLQKQLDIDSEIKITEDKIKKLEQLKLEVISQNPMITGISGEDCSKYISASTRKNNFANKAINPKEQEYNDGWEEFDKMCEGYRKELRKYDKKDDVCISDTSMTKYTVDPETFVGPMDAIAEVERLAPEHYKHVEDILASMGFERSIPLNDKWMIYLKRAVMPTWNLLDIETLRPMEVKNVTVEYAVKVHVPDLFMTGNEWRVISDGLWHSARFTDKDEPVFEVIL